MGFLEAAIALAFGYYKREKEVNVFYWIGDKLALGQMPWEDGITVEDAIDYCDLLDVSFRHYNCFNFAKISYLII